jgi:hypothetical protein
MNKIIGILMCFCAFACANNSKKVEEADLILHFNLVWEVNKNANNPQMDHHAQAILNTYQALLKGIASKDTTYIKTTSLLLIKTSDSLSALTMSKDTTMQEAWMNGLGRISDELQGVLESNTQGDTKELSLSMNMLSIQLLNWLASIGYKEQHIYIFVAPNEYIEDGIYWLGLQKNANNPFQQKKEEWQAVGFLQESK